MSSFPSPCRCHTGNTPAGTTSLRSATLDVVQVSLCSLIRYNCFVDIALCALTDITHPQVMEMVPSVFLWNLHNSVLLWCLWSKSNWQAVRWFHWVVWVFCLFCIWISHYSSNTYLYSLSLLNVLGTLVNDPCSCRFTASTTGWPIHFLTHEGTKHKPTS